MAQYTGMTNSYGNWQQQQQASALAQEHAASLQVAVVTSLRCLSYEGGLLCLSVLPVVH